MATFTPRLAPFSLVIRESDKKCRGERNGKPLTKWLPDGMAVLEEVRSKEKS